MHWGICVWKLCAENCVEEAVCGSCVGGAVFHSCLASLIRTLERSLLNQSLFDSVLIMGFNNKATCLGMTFLYWGMCKVTPHFGCSSVADVYRYITA